jgi:hypothetical protein
MRHALRNNYLCTYDLYSPVHNVLDACIFFTWGSGREFFGPREMETRRLHASKTL